MYVKVLIGLNEGKTLFATQFKNGSILVRYNGNQYVYNNTPGNNEYEVVNLYGRK